jgi:hypothetical protein
MSNNNAAEGFSNIIAKNPSKDVSPEAIKYIKNFIGANTDLPISDIIEMLNQVYLVKNF